MIDPPFSILHPRAAFDSGFTLLEIMVVLVLIGILSAMILPEMRGTYEEALLRSTSRKLVNAFNLAYSRAVSLNQVHRVRLDRQTGRYAIERRVRESPSGGEFALVQDLPGTEGELDSRISVLLRTPNEIPAGPLDAGAPGMTSPESAESSRAEAVAFYPDGTADNIEVQLTDRQGFRLLLRINPVTARVHIIDLGRELAGPPSSSTARPAARVHHLLRARMNNSTPALN